MKIQVEVTIKRVIEITVSKRPAAEDFKAILEQEAKEDLSNTDPYDLVASATFNVIGEDDEDPDEAEEDKDRRNGTYGPEYAGEKF